MSTVSLSNASKGLKKVYTAQVIAILACIVLIVGGIFAAKSPNPEDPSILAKALLASGYAVFAVYAFLEMFGLQLAAQDDKGYKIAFILTLGVILATIVAGILSFFFPAVFKGNAEEGLIKVFSFLATYYVISTSVRLLRERGAEKEAAFGKVSMIFCLSVYGAKVLLDLVLALIRTASDTALLVFGIIELLLLLASIVSYVVYMLFLGKTWPKL